MIMSKPRLMRTGPGSAVAIGEVEGRAAGVAAVDAEHLADHAELERRDAGEGENDDFLEHVGSFRGAGS